MEDSDHDNAEEKPSVSFRKSTRKRIATLRKRTEDKPVKKQQAKAKPHKKDDEDEEASGSEKSEGTSKSSEEGGPVTVKRTLFGNRNRRLKKNPMMMKSKPRGRDTRPSVSGSDSDSGSGPGELEFVPITPVLLKTTPYKSSNTAVTQVPKDMGATKVPEHDTEHDKDYQSQFERVQKQLKEDEKAGPSTSGTKIYRGLKMYGAREAQDTVKGKASSGINHYGPIRAQVFMRASVRWDFAPDICKDYKETDSCKFLHDRSDYKHGWEIEQDWEKEQAEKKKNKPAEEEDYTIHSDDE